MPKIFSEKKFKNTKRLLFNRPTIEENSNLNKNIEELFHSNAMKCLQLYQFDVINDKPLLRKDYEWETTEDVRHTDKSTTSVQTKIYIERSMEKKRSAPSKTTSKLTMRAPNLRFIK